MLNPTSFQIGKCYVAEGQNESGSNEVGLIFKFLGNTDQKKMKVEIVHILYYDEYAPDIGEIGEVSYEELKDDKVTFRNMTKAEEVLYGRKDI